MSDTQPISPSSSEDVYSVAEAQLGPVSQAIEETFTGLARSLSEELARASADGRRSISDLADGIIEDLARLAAQRLVAEPLQSALGSAVNRAAQSSGDRFLRSLIKRSLRNG